MHTTTEINFQKTVGFSCNVHVILMTVNLLSSSFYNMLVLQSILHTVTCQLNCLPDRAGVIGGTFAEPNPISLVVLIFHTLSMSGQLFSRDTRSNQGQPGHLYRNKQKNNAKQ